MSVAVVARFLTLGSFAALALSAWLVLDRRSTRLIGDRVLWLGAGMAAVAMVGSLYLSEVAGFTPCRLCWYQRIAMYPLVVVLGVAAIRRDLAAWRTAAVLAGIGGLISVWHYLQQWFPTLGSEACDATAPCTAVWFRVFGFASIPYLALVSFLTVLAACVAARRLERDVLVQETT
jgi:disulfide bond formation protein DsbB